MMWDGRQSIHGELLYMPSIRTSSSHWMAMTSCVRLMAWCRWDVLWRPPCTRRKSPRVASNAAWQRGYRGYMWIPDSSHCPSSQMTAQMIAWLIWWLAATFWRCLAETKFGSRLWTEPAMKSFQIYPGLHLDYLDAYAGLTEWHGLMGSVLDGWHIST